MFMLHHTERERRAYVARVDLYRHYRHKVLPDLIRATTDEASVVGTSSDVCPMSPDSLDDDEDTAGACVMTFPSEDEAPPPTPVQAFLRMVEREAIAAYAKYGKKWGVFFRST